MPGRTYSGEEVIEALGRWRFRKVDQTGSHVKLRYQHPETGEKRTVSVPLHDELATGTLKSIADRAGADDFQTVLDAIEVNGKSLPMSGLPDRRRSVHSYNNPSTRHVTTLLSTNL